MAKVSPVPEDFNSVSAYLIVPNCVNALDFYARAFGAVTRYRMAGPSDSTMHAEMQLGDSVVMMSDENPAWNVQSPVTLGGTSVHLHFYCEDANAMWDQAVTAGCEVVAPLMDAFWGDRFGKLKDPFGHIWGVASHIEDVSEEEMAKRQAEWMEQMAAGEECSG